MSIQVDSSIRRYRARFFKKFPDRKISNMWAFNAVLLVVWFVLKFVLHKGGFVHILLITAISIFVVQLLGYRKTRYHRISSGH